MTVMEQEVGVWEEKVCVGRGGGEGHEDLILKVLINMTALMYNHIIIKTVFPFSFPDQSNRLPVCRD